LAEVSRSVKFAQLAAEMEARGLGRVSVEECLSAHTTWKVGGPVDLWVEPTTEEALETAIEMLDTRHIPWVVLGKGSNTLADDEGFRGAVFNLEKGLHQITRTAWSDGVCQVEASAGAPIAGLLRFAVREKIAGLEMLTGVPGTVGGAVRMNAGTHLGEAKDSLLEVKVLRDGGAIAWESVEELGLRYRTSNIGPRDIVVSARFRGRKEGGELVGQVIREVRERRRQTQPLTEPSGGSTFANPEEGRAWSFLDEAGFRGRRIGGAWFSEMHPNFLVQGGEATAQDMKDLIELAKEDVKRLCGVQLREEVSRLERNGWRTEECGS
jgi:UDP-N-acetylmuramate dehydrogenase